MLRLVVSVPFLLFLVLFVLSNREQVSIGLWPTDVTWEVPLSIAVLVVAAIAFVFGGVLVWMTELAQRRRARRAESYARLLEEQVAALRARVGAAG